MSTTSNISNNLNNNNNDSSDNSDEEFSELFEAVSFFVTNVYLCTKKILIYINIL